jgi:hypothetical protein
MKVDLRRVFFGGLPFFLALAGLSFACSDSSTKTSRTPVTPGADFYVEEEPVVPNEPDTINPNGFQAAERAAPPQPTDAGSDADAATDARAPDAGPSDAGPPLKVYCTALSPGDLVITEFLISSRSGSGDDGEWIEVSSTKTCTLKADGLVIESPRGTAFDAVTLPAGSEVPPLGKFLVAGSAVRASAFGLPEPTYFFAATDVLKNDGDRISVRLGTTVIDRLDYPAFSNVTPARSVAFPKDCPSTVRGDWTRWSLTFSTYAAGAQRGTPGRDNVDVACY